MRRLLVLLLSAFCLSSLAFAQTERQVGAKKLSSELGEAFVTLKVEYTSTVSCTMWGEDYNEESNAVRQLIPVTIVSKDGLGIAASGADVQTEVAESVAAMFDDEDLAEYIENLFYNVQIDKMVYVMSDGREIPVEIIIVDVKNDLAVLRPTEAIVGDLTFVDVENSTDPDLLSEILTPVRTIAELGHPVAIIPDYIIGVVSEPKDYYIAGGNTRYLADGVPCFALDGRFIGLQIEFKADLERDDRSFIDSGFTPVTVILPAKYIAEILENVK